MKSGKKYYKDIDLIRLLSCIAVLLYHLNLLKGGYLAVCVFFVLSGYLSCISAFRKENFSILSYYSNRLLKIYLPLLIVVFTTLSIVSLFPNLDWFNLKPETTSVLLGYNNFWQLSANLDYFARHINSPFMHLWYISILLQFELIFPCIYIPLRKLGDKINKIIPCLITTILSIIAAIYFYKMSLSANIMVVYYNTFTRIFSLLFGLSLGFVHSYYGSLISEKLKKGPINKVIFYIYLLTLICLFIFIDADSIYFPISMIVSTLITCRLIDYGTIVMKDDLSVCDKVIKSLSEVSYEVYLIQYPIIFLFQSVNVGMYLKIPMIIILTIILSYGLHNCINFNNKSAKFKKIKYVMRLIILFILLYGVYQYYLSEDHTVEMKALEDQLAQNQQIIEKKQEEYAAAMKQEENDWGLTLENLENGENELKDIVTNLPIVGIGDSVMLGAVENLYQTFPKGYFDAKVSRTAWVVKDILVELKNKNILGNPIVLNLGANGDCSEACKIEIIEKCGDSEIFWINVTNDNDVHINDKLIALASKYSNLHVIDWNSISKGHSEYFISDGIHLTEIGRKVYAQSIYDAIYQVYLEAYNAKKEEIIKQHEEKLKTKVSFYGNDILLNIFDSVQADFSDAKFVINSKFNYKTLKSEIENSLKDNSLTYKVVFAFDNTLSLSLSEYRELIELCKEHEIYILSTNKQSDINLADINFENVTIIDFYKEIQSHTNYLMIDGIHLTEVGNKALRELLNNVINTKNVENNISKDETIAKIIEFLLTNIGVKPLDND